MTAMIRKVSLVASALVLTSALPALAQSHGPYLGASVGVCKTRDRDYENALAWKAYGGHSLGRFIALEGGYDDLGTRDNGWGDQLRLWGVSGFGILKINVGPTNLFGKVGITYMRGTVVDSGSDATTGTGLAYGGGLSVSLGKVGVRAEAEWFDVPEVGKPFRATAGLMIGF